MKTKVTVIIGKQCSVNTKKAIELANGRRYTHQTIPFSVKEIYLSELVIIENVYNEKELKAVNELIKTKSIEIRKPYTEDDTEQLQLPELIITTSTFKETDFVNCENLKFIHL